MIDYGSSASIQVGDQQWSGRSGRPFDTLAAKPARVASPLWLIDLLSGITDTEECEPEELGSQGWRRFAVTINLADASAAAPDGMASPSQDRFESLYKLSAEVWLDDTHLRQIRFIDWRQTYTLTLSDFGTQTDTSDWTRLPTFRSPSERRALVARGRWGSSSSYRAGRNR